MTSQDDADGGRMVPFPAPQHTVFGEVAAMLLECGRRYFATSRSIQMRWCPIPTP